MLRRQEFANDFSVSQWRDTSERAMRPSVNPEKSDTDACDFLQQKMRELCPGGSILAAQLPEKSTLKSEIGLSNFGMKKGSLHSSVEKLGLWTARLTTVGRCFR